MIKSPETGAYQFKDTIIDKELTKEFFAKK
jgi:hypothetical protein